MTKDFFDLLSHLRRDQGSNVASNLIQGLCDRQNGNINKNFKTKENLEIYAEDEFVRKEEHKDLCCDMPGVSGSTFLMVFSPDGTKVASTHGNHNIYVSDIKTGKNIRILTGHPGTPWCIAFHPTSNQIIASGCLGGQVRIWDLSGGSEVWTAANQTVIASLAFHPNDRVLAIATYNGIYFWDWSQPEPFVHAATYNLKEKVRFVAFDALGHKLITGIANSPLTGWERVGAPVPVPRHQRYASPYRRRITQRLVNNAGATSIQPSVTRSDSPTAPNQREQPPSSSDRQRNINRCYHSLVKEYEQLVKRFLHLRPIMVDRGADPMGPMSSSDRSLETPATRAESGVRDAGASGSSNEPGGSRDAVPSTSGTSRFERDAAASEGVGEADKSPEATSTKSQSPSKSAHNLLTPSRIFSVIKKPNTLIRGTQTTSESRKIKARDCDGEPTEKRFKKIDGSVADIAGSSDRESPANTEVHNGSPDQSNAAIPGPSGLGSSSTQAPPAETSTERQATPTSADVLRLQIRQNVEQELKVRLWPIIRSVPASDRAELMRLFKVNRERARSRIANARNVNRHAMDTTSDSSSSSDDQPSEPRWTMTNIDPSTSRRTGILASTPESSGSTSGESARDFNRELDEIVTSLLNDVRNTGRTTENSSNSNTTNIRQGNLPQPRSTTFPTAQPSPPVTETSTSSSLAPSLSCLSRSSGVGNQFLHQLLEVLQNRVPEGPSVLSNTNTRTTNSTVYTASTGGNAQSPPRGRSDFMAQMEMVFSNRQPARMIQAPQLIAEDSRDASRQATNQSNSNVDELTNYSEMENSEDDPPPPPPPPPDENHPEDLQTVIRQVYSNIMRELESSLDMVRVMGSATRTSDISNTLNNFSSVLDNIVVESSIILRSLGISHRISEPMSMGTARLNTSNSVTWNASDPSFYVRDLRTAPSVNTNARPQAAQANSHIVHLHDPLQLPPANLWGVPGLVNPVFSDHTYPRHPPTEAGGATSGGEQRNINTTPLVATINLTVSHIIRQTRSLREQLDVMEQIERSSIEVEQLRLIRKLITQLMQTMNSCTDDVSPFLSTNVAAVTSMGQMLAVTRISDTLTEESTPASPSGADVSNSESSFSAYQNEANSTSVTTSGAEDLAGSSKTPPTENLAGSSVAAPAEDRPGSPRLPVTENNPIVSSESSTSTDPATSSGTHFTRSRCRKTYPPSGMSRVARQNRKIPLLARRSSSRGDRQGHRLNNQIRSSVGTSVGTTQTSTNPRFAQPTAPYVGLDPNNLTSMTRRLEILLTEQMRFFASLQRPRAGANRSAAMLGEHILALRLHGCVLRMSRVLRQPIPEGRTDLMTAVTRDGYPRYNARHFISLVIDSVSRFVEEMAGTRGTTRTVRSQTHLVLSTALLLTELLHLIVVDTIPPTLGSSDFNPERGGLALRIENMCNQMLDSRPQILSAQLTRIVRLIRVTLRNACENVLIGEPFHSRRNLNQRNSNRPVERGRPVPNPNPPRPHTAQNVPPTGVQQPPPTGAPQPYLAGIPRQLLIGVPQLLSPILSPPPPSRVSQRFPVNPQAMFNEWHSTILNLINQNAIAVGLVRAAVARGGGGSSATPETRNDFSSTNENSDDDDEASPVHSSITVGTLYRTSSVINLASNNLDSASTSRPLNPPSVQINDVPVSEAPGSHAQRVSSQRQRFIERISELRSNPHVGMFRPRFLHPFYASVNPFDADLDDPQRELVFDSDMITTVTPNHRIQVWDIAKWCIPSIGSATRNVVVTECKIHNDASVDIAKDGSILVTLLPSGGYLNVTNRLGVYSLRWETLGQCLYTTSFEQNAVSVSLSPLARHLVVGLASRIVPSERFLSRWTMARIFKIEQKDQPGDRLPAVRDLTHSRDSRINCIRWLPTSGEGLIYATNTGNLTILT